MKTKMMNSIKRFNDRFYFTRTTCVAFVILMCVVQSEVAAVQVECKTSLTQMAKQCVVGQTTSRSEITLVAQDPGSNCIMNNNYYLALNGASSYIWVFYGCSGVFDVSTSNPGFYTWGAWAPCSVTCGAGSRTRQATCSTGRSEDCTTATLPDSSAAVEACTPGACSTNKGLPMCGFSPTGYRVFGGRDADKCQFPWMAMVHKPGTLHRCGGTIVDHTHILTAAHCLSRFDARMLRSIEDKPDTLMVYTGSSTMPMTPNDDPTKIMGLKEHKVVRVDVHKDFNGFNFANDIAVLTLAQPILYDHCTVPVCLIDSQMSVYDARECGTMGWGKTEDPKTANGTNRLQWTTLEIISEDKCRYYYGMWYQPKVFCAGGNGHDACDGDSGGPLVCKGAGGRYYQYGIISSGFRDICGQYAGMYTHLHHYTEWLKQHLV